MKKFLLFLLFTFSPFAAAQISQIGNPVDRGSSLPATCFVGQGPFFKTSAADGLGAIGIYSCNATNTWTGPFGTGGGGGGVSSVTGAGSVSCSPTTGDVTCTGSGTVNPTVTAGSGGVTQNLLAAEDTSNPGNFVLPASGNCGVGIAATTATSGNTFVLEAIPGLVYTAVADGSITSGHVLIGGTATPGRVKDSGGTQGTGVPIGTCFMAKALASATIGQTLPVLYLGLKFGVSGVASYTGSLTAGHIATWTGTGGQLQDGGAPLAANVLPAASSLTWHNQNSSTTTQKVANGPILAYIPDTNSSGDWSFLTAAQPSTPYSFIVQLHCVASYGGGQDCGVYFYDSVLGYLAGVEFFSQSSTGQIFRIHHITNPSSGSNTAPATYGLQQSSSQLCPYASPLWVKLRNDGTTLYYDYSPDGINFTNVYSEAVGAFLTPNNIGVSGWSGCNNAACFMQVDILGWTLVPNATL